MFSFGPASLPGTAKPNPFASSNTLFGSTSNPFTSTSTQNPFLAPMGGNIFSNPNTPNIFSRPANSTTDIFKPPTEPISQLFPRTSTVPPTTSSRDTVPNNTDSAQKQQHTQERQAGNTKSSVQDHSEEPNNNRLGTIKDTQESSEKQESQTKNKAKPAGDEGLTLINKQESEEESRMMSSSQKLQESMDEVEMKSYVSKEQVIEQIKECIKREQGVLFDLGNVKRSLLRKAISNRRNKIRQQIDFNTQCELKVGQIENAIEDLIDQIAQIGQSKEGGAAESTASRLPSQVVGTDAIQKASEVSKESIRNMDLLRKLQQIKHLDQRVKATKTLNDSLEQEIANMKTRPRPHSIPQIRQLNQANQQKDQHQQQVYDLSKRIKRQKHRYHQLVLRIEPRKVAPSSVKEQGKYPKAQSQPQFPNVNICRNVNANLVFWICCSLLFLALISFLLTTFQHSTDMCQDGHTLGCIYKRITQYFSGQNRIS